MTFAVFILTNGNWKMHGTFFNKADAVREKEYLINMLGLKAEIFQQRSK
jgi:hypothetical protein